MYSFITRDNFNKKVGKGIKKGVLAKEVKHEHYLNCLRTQCQSSYPMTNIRSFNHEIYTVVCKKRGLTSYDDKRYILSDGIHTRPYGHYLVRKHPCYGCIINHPSQREHDCLMDPDHFRRTTPDPEKEFRQLE